jgi:hypothetical protein
MEKFTVVKTNLTNKGVNLNNGWNKKKEFRNCSS